MQVVWEEWGVSAFWNDSHVTMLGSVEWAQKL